VNSLKIENNPKNQVPYMKLLLLLIFLTSFLKITSQTLISTTIFNNGDPIQEAKIAAEWEQYSMNSQPVFMKKFIEGKAYFFYNWYAVSDIRGLTKEAWMIPNANELQIWNAYQPITIQPIGIISEQGFFTKLTEQQYFWTSSEFTEKGNRESAFAISLSNPNIGKSVAKQAFKQEGFMVMQVEKDKLNKAISEVTNVFLASKNAQSTITKEVPKTEMNNNLDANKIQEVGNYNSVRIGNQVWMTENLNVDRFRNGDLIPEAKTEEEWKKAGENKQPAWCYYDNDPKNGEKYGKLYNWYAVNDPRGLAPKGWHIPSHAEWITLTDYLGGEEVAGGKMKSTSGWNSGWNENSNGTNSSGFSGLPGGERHYDGTFKRIGNFGSWWTSTENDRTTAWFHFMGYFAGYVYRANDGKSNGFSVRCIKD
jgi:uncharacterized protein (TIGR02145 family)